MGSGEAATPKPKKASSPVQEQTTIHPHPDWATLQAYYGPGVAIPPPYFPAAVASGHARPHPYMWGPQPMMSAYAIPYAAIYPRGVFSHPSVPLGSQKWPGSHSHCVGILPSSSTNEAVMMVSPSSMYTPVKLTSNKGKGLLKRFKRLDGNAVPIGNGTADNTSGSTAQGSSQSGDYGAEGSSDASDGNNEPGENKAQRNSSRDAQPISGKGGKAVMLDNAVNGGETNSMNTKGNPVGNTSSVLTPGTEGMGPANGEGKVKAPLVPPTTNAMVPGHGGVPMELWTQDERELKRERRKQSNRESARRSRLRKQAETEELFLTAETLNAENLSLRSKICQLKDSSDNLILENSALQEKLKKAQPSPSEDFSSSKTDHRESPPTENLLSKINNSSSCNTSRRLENGVQDNSGGRLHQLLDPNPRTDAVAAG